MKFLKLNMLFVITAVLLVSCSKDNDILPEKINEVENLQLVKSFTKNGYTMELFNNSGNLKVGYNKIYLRLTDKNGNYVTQSSINWTPMMTMNMGGEEHQHSCPFSDISKVTGKETLFEGYIVFIMASNGANAFWNLDIDFTADGQHLTVNNTVNVVSTASQYHKVYTSAMGSDGTMYLLVLVEPNEPEIGTNDIVVALFKKEGDHDFPMVDNYNIKVDPRMPGMGYHSAPGNQDMIQGNDGFYHGRVGFSMSGYWQINLILENASGAAVKGEPFTDQNPESSLNFKLEF